MAKRVTATTSPKTATTFLATAVVVLGDYIVAVLVAENGDYSGQCGRHFRKYIIVADSIRDSIRIRIVTTDSIQYSIRTQTADSQVPIRKMCRVNR